MPIRTLELTIDGQAAPQGSKSAFMNKKTGRITLVESSKKLKPWRAMATASLRDKALEIGWAKVMRPEPVSVEICFGIQPPKTMVREYPTTKPDIDKQTRTILDAITQAEIIWEDDSQVIGLVVSKVYMNPPKTEVRINVRLRK
jgi:Holliday junction resolvase RusA-like endonuclease